MKKNGQETNVFGNMATNLLSGRKEASGGSDQEAQRYKANSVSKNVEKNLIDLSNNASLTPRLAANSLKRLKHSDSLNQFVASSKDQKNIYSPSSLNKQKKNMEDKLLTNKLLMQLDTPPVNKNSKVFLSSSKESRGKTNSLFQMAQSRFSGEDQETLAKKLNWIRKNVIGFNTRYISQLKLQVESVYIDHTATNRPFKPVQTMVDHSKLMIANPHTEFSKFGKFSTELMHESLQSLLKSFNASSDSFVALPTGSGSTGAIQKAINFLINIDNKKQASVYITPYQHHSNILPWIEFYQTLNVFDHDHYGNILFDKAQKQIRADVNENLIVSISAASNVTSQITNLKDMNDLIGRIRAEGKKDIVFAADCAAFCCHHHLDLKKYDQLDFAFLSPHKNLGGSESCGVLVARKSLLNSSKPTFPGGGTVRFVKGYSKEDVLYEVDPFSREIAGTPPFLGFYRAALSFQLLTNVIGYSYIHKRQQRNTQIFVKMINQSNQLLKKDGNDTLINMYGDKNFKHRANVITFNFQYGTHYIQHSFASLIYTDVFGIQIRSGCFCAGPFGISLLHMDEEKINKIQEEVEAGIMINKPGYLRLDLTFYLEEYEVEYIAAATLLIARYWRNFSRLYTICNDGEVLLLPIFKRKIPELYSLGDLRKAEQILRKQQLTHQEKLNRRRQTLEFQLKRAQEIAKEPINFLKKINNGIKFKIDEL